MKVGTEAHLQRHNDISLIRTAKEIVFSKNVQPIALPTQNFPAGGNTPVILSGWGKNSRSVRSFKKDSSIGKRFK